MSTTGVTQTTAHTSQKGGPKSYSLNSRQNQPDYDSGSNFSRTPNSRIPLELQQMNGKSDTTSQTTAATHSMLKKGLKVIQERVSATGGGQAPSSQHNVEGQQNNRRNPAKSAVVSSQKFRKAMEESSDNELIDPQSKGGKFIQKLTERQKRMEERYFKKDGKPYRKLKFYLVQTLFLYLNTLLR